MILKLIVVTVVVLAAIVAYKLWKAGKAVTGTAVVAGVEADVKSAVAAVKADVTKK